jgi:UDP-glucose 4-epimerase
VLVTGLGTFWGGRVAQALERDPDVDVIVGLDSELPSVELERTEYVRCDDTYSILARIVRATQVDTILHTFLIVDSTHRLARNMHEINVIGTLNLLAAASQAASSVRTVVVKSHAWVYGTHEADPRWFTETTARAAPAPTRVERSLAEAEQYVDDFTIDNPDVRIATLRFPSVLGDAIETPLSRALAAPMVPAIAGFDPGVQFVHEDDVVRALLFAARDERCVGTMNVAGDGVVPWSELAAITGRPRVQLPPVGTDTAMRALAPFGIPRLPHEMVELLRYGRALDTSKARAAGFVCERDTVATVHAAVRAQRLQRALPRGPSTYRYQSDVEAFFRRSPAVVAESVNPVP